MEQGVMAQFSEQAGSGVHVRLMVVV